MNSQSNSTQENSTKSQNKTIKANNKMNSQNEEDIFEEDNIISNKKNDLKQDNNAHNLESFQLSDSSPLFDLDDDTDDENKGVKQNNATQNNKNTQKPNDNNGDSDDYLDITEEDEGELDVSEEIKNEDKDQIKKQTENTEKKDNTNQNNENDFDFHGLSSSSSQENKPNKSTILSKKEINDSNNTLEQNEEPAKNNCAILYDDIMQEKSHLHHLIKKEFANSELQTLFQALFTNIGVDIYFVYGQEEQIEENNENIRETNQRNEKINVIENTEEEIKPKHRRRKHRRSKFDNEFEEKSGENQVFLDDDEMEIINNYSNDDDDEKEKEILSDENEIKTEKNVDIIQKAEEEEKNEKEENIFEEEENKNEILPENDKKEEEEKSTKNSFNEEEEKSAKDSFNEDEKRSSKERILDLFNEDDEVKISQGDEKKNQKEKILDLFNEEEEDEISINDEEKNNKKEKENLNNSFEEEEEIENQKENEKMHYIICEEEEEKSQKENNSFIEEKENQISFKEEEEEKNSFNEEEEMKNKDKKDEDMSNEDGNIKSDDDLLQTIDAIEDKSEEEINETNSIIPSEQFGIDLNISPIKKTEKRKNTKIDNLTELGKIDSDEIKKSSFKEKILQQFSNEDQDYSDTIEKQRKLIENEILPISSSLINHPGSRIDDEIEKEQVKKKQRRRRRIQNDKIDNQIETKKVDINTIQQKPKINRKGRKRSINKVITNTEEANNVFNNNNSNENIKTGQNKFISTPARTKKIVKKRARSAQKPSNKQSTTPTEIEISSLKLKKIKPRSESVKIKHSKKHKKLLSDISTQTDKFQIDENQIFVFEKVKSKNTYHFITNNNYYDLEIVNEKEREPETETEVETENINNFLPIINKRRKLKQKNTTPIKRKKVSPSKSKKTVDDDEEKKFNESLNLKKNQRPRRNMSEQPRIRKKMKPIEETDDDDNIVIDFGDTMYECDQQYSPQTKIEAKKKEELYNRYRPKRKHRNVKEVPIHLISLTTNDAFPESESSEVFRNEDSFDDDDTNKKRKTNHQWNMDEIFDANSNKNNKNKTLKTKNKTKLKTKSKTKKRSKSVSHISEDKNDDKKIETNKNNKNEEQEEQLNTNIILPAIKRRPLKRQRKQKQTEPKTYDGNNDEIVKENERFNYDNDIKNQTLPKINKNERNKKKFSQTYNPSNNLNGKTVDIMKDILSYDSSEKYQNHYYSNESIPNSPSKRKTKKLSQAEAIEITDSITYETEELVNSNHDYSDKSEREIDYEGPKELLDNLNMAFHCATWEAALNGIYKLDLLKTLALNDDDDYYSE